MHPDPGCVLVYRLVGVVIAYTPYPAEPTSETAEALGITHERAEDMTARVEKAFEGINTQDLDDSFLGLSDGTQAFAMKLLADPTQKAALFNKADDATLTELGHFLEGLPEDEWKAVQKALLL